jgi:hypothetical protein
MTPNADRDSLVPLHERKLLEAVDVLGQARLDLLAATAGATESSQAPERQAAQAQRRSDGVRDA